MAIATLTSKGRIIMPLSVRNALGLRPGAKVEFVAHGDGFKVVPLRNEVTTLKGRFAGRVAKPVSLEVMDNAIRRAASERHRKKSA
jgi:AbrB family looped-hinge helix DNA binding protein